MDLDVAAEGFGADPDGDLLARIACVARGREPAAVVFLVNLEAQLRQNPLPGVQVGHDDPLDRNSFLPGVVLVWRVPAVVLARLVPGVILVRFARRDVVDVRNHIVRRVIVQGERAAGVLQWDRSTRALGLLLLRFRAPETLRLGVGAEVAASRRDGCRGIDGTRRAPERRRGTRAEAGAARKTPLCAGPRGRDLRGRAPR